MLSDDGFWALVDEARLRGGGDPFLQSEELFELLVDRAPEEVIAFARRWSELEARAWRRELYDAAVLLNGGCSDDGFGYFVAWLISLGEDAYDAALEDPDTLADQVQDGVLFYEADEIRDVPEAVHLALTGQPFPRGTVPVPPPVPLAPDAAQVRRMFPRLAHRLERGRPRLEMTGGST